MLSLSQGISVPNKNLRPPVKPHNQTRWYPWGIQRLVSTYSNWPTGQGEGFVMNVKTQSAKICLNFNFQRGGGVLNQISEQGVLRNLSTNFALPLSGSLCITDSLSHTTYVQTNKILTCRDDISTCPKKPFKNTNILNLLRE